MTRLRAALALTAGGLVAGAAAAAAAPPAPSVGPDAAGWWSSTNRSAAVPTVAPPDVGAKDLYVAGSNALPGQLTDPTGAGPMAIAALHFTLPDGTAGKSLRLTLAGTHPPAVTLTACRATTSFTSAYDGAWADAPSYDCSDSGTARLAADGTVLIDGVDGLRDGRELAVVLVPGPLDRVVLAAPGRSTLALSPAASPLSTAPGGGGALPPAGPAAAPGATAGAVPPATNAGLAPTTGGLPGVPPSAAPPAVAAPAPVAAPQTVANASASLPTRPWPALLATLLVALAAFVPIARPLRRTPVAGATTRGVGRFRSERSGAVPDLV